MSRGRASWLAAGALVGVLAAGSARAQLEPGSFEAIQKEHEIADGLARRKAEIATTDAERKAAGAAIWKETKSAAAKAFAWAEARPDDPRALDAIIWTIHGLANGSYPEYTDEQAKAYRLLTEKGLASEKIVPICYYAGGESIACPEARRFLEAALERSPSRLVRGAACLGLAKDDHASARFARLLKDEITRGLQVERWKGTGVVERAETIDADARDQRAVTLYDRLSSEFGDLKLPQPYNQLAFAEIARGDLYELRSLAIGRPMPEFEGEDVRGGEIRLADYRGKVVAVVFWATWCGPCMAAVPQERELIKRMRGKPFALIGVDGDDDRALAAEVMAKESMTWPSIWNGGASGGIVEKFGVRSWPTLYLLDARGVIRYRNLNREILDKAVDKLVAEVEAK